VLEHGNMDGFQCNMTASLQQTYDSRLPAACVMLGPANSRVFFNAFKQHVLASLLFADDAASQPLECLSVCWLDL
jgi:hypothetical protein